MDLQEAEKIISSAEQKSGAELTLLFSISTILDQSVDLADVIQPVLNVLVEKLELQRGVITLLNRNSGEILIEASYGLSHDEKNRARYRLGEGITGTVVASGKPRLILDITKEPQFLDKTGARQRGLLENVSFICLPIKIGNDAVGTLSIYLRCGNEESLQRHFRLLSIVASLISQAVKLRQKLLEEQERLIEENYRLQTELSERYRPAHIIGDSAPMQEIFDKMAQFCQNNDPVAIHGESGTGKELISTAIHYNSSRRSLPNLKISCIAIPEEILEEELFGFEQPLSHKHNNNYTQGKLEQAQGGTLLLVEIGDMPNHTQQKLLRFLTEHKFELKGSNRTIRSTTRIIVTTNKDLEAMTRQGSFRNDLLQLLNAQSMYIPPLRERKSDIPQLTNFFIEYYTQKYHKQISRISTGAINMLMSYHWPGNVSELESCIEHSVIVNKDKVIHPHHLPPTLQTAEHTNTLIRESLENSLNKLEHSILLDAIKVCRGSLSRAAKMLQLTERVMGLRIKKHGIDPKNFR